MQPGSLTAGNSLVSASFSSACIRTFGSCTFTFHSHCLPFICLSPSVCVRIFDLRFYRVRPAIRNAPDPQNKLDQPSKTQLNRTSSTLCLIHATRPMERFQPATRSASDPQTESGPPPETRPDAQTESGPPPETRPDAQTESGPPPETRQTRRPSPTRHPKRNPTHRPSPARHPKRNPTHRPSPARHPKRGPTHGTSPARHPKRIRPPDRVRPATRNATRPADRVRNPALMLPAPEHLNDPTADRPTASFISAIKKRRQDITARQVHDSGNGGALADEGEGGGRMEWRRR
ncbi:proline-rich protein 2-like [Penaeus indicus]|uniref:proline-rich protein 2-like n=1 Tax=Penaeus indicus TaxID=29960 RepID=UPI00300D7017